MPESYRQRTEVVDQFTRQAESYAQLTQQLGSKRRSPIIDVAKPRSDDIVLDVCCGAGSLTLSLAPLVSHITGADLTEAMLEQARSAAAMSGVTNVEWITGSSDNLPFTNDAFSLVTSSAAFHHLEIPADTLAEMARVCAPGGRIVLMDFAFTDSGKAAAFDETERMRDPSHVHAFTLRELRALAAGLPLRERSALVLPPRSISFEMVLATSHPTACTVATIRERILADAETGRDLHGLSAKLVDGEIVVSYPQGIVAWDIAAPDR